MTILIRNHFMPGEFNNYLIAGNVCNAFALGELGSTDDFFLVGAEPEDESNYPLLTGNILDSEGNVLFRLVRNVLVINPGHCSRILGDHVGYEIHDGDDVTIFKTQTLFETLPGEEEEMFVTTLGGTFYNKHGELVFSANSGEQDERIEANVKFTFGFRGGFGLVRGMSEEELDFARMVLTSRGAIHEAVRGHLDSKEFTLDGKALIEAKITNCKVNVKKGDFDTYGKCIFENNEFVFHGAAANIRNLVLALEKQAPRK